MFNINSLNKISSASLDQAVRFWNLNTPVPNFTLKGLKRVSFAPISMMVAIKITSSRTKRIIKQALMTSAVCLLARKNFYYAIYSLKFFRRDIMGAL